MGAPTVVRTAIVILFLTFLAGTPARAQEALAIGLKGHVHTVLTEEFTTEGGVRGESRGSTLDVYRYKPDGSLWARTVYSRNGWQVFKIQTTGTSPFQSSTTQNVFDAEGHAIETDTYNENGGLVSKTTNELVQKQGNTTVYQRTETSANGPVSTTEVSDTTDPQTGITHQVETRDGKLQTDWVIQRNRDGTNNKDKIVYGDGAYNEREHRPDGTTVEDRYSALTKSHTYQQSDAQGHLIAVIEKSDSQYIRCTYSFDKEGRPTGQINYDAAGNVIDKSTAEYRDDPHGNWIEKKSIVWDTKVEPMQPKIIMTTLRTINYY